MRTKQECVFCSRHCTYQLVIRITDWTDDKDEPAYDVELYIQGVYDWNESEAFTTVNHITDGKRDPWTKEQARQAAIEYAQSQIRKLLK